VSKGGSKSTSKTEPLFPPEAGKIFGMERELLAQTILPMEQQRIRALGALGRGDFAGAQPILSPALAAARQAQARLGASMQEMPSNVAAPIQERLARQAQGIPQQLQAYAPEDLAAMVQALIGPQFGGLFAPGSKTTGRGGGPSSLQTGMSAASTAATIAALALAFGSSRTWKEQIEPFLGGLAEVLELRPMAFHYRSQTPWDDGRAHLGFIAEDAALIDPSLAIYDDLGHPITLNIHAFLALLVGAVQTLATDVHVLAERMRQRQGEQHG
jgi:hypothetical protein